MKNMYDENDLKSIKNVSRGELKLDIFKLLDAHLPKIKGLKELKKKISLLS